MNVISKLSRVFSRNSYFASAISLCVICVAALYADSIMQKALMHNLEDEVSSELNLLKTKLEGNLNSNVQLVRGLVYTIKTEPELDQKRFSQLSEHIFHDESLLNIVAAAPDLINKMVYPFDKYKKIIGMDYNNSPKHLIPALEAKRLGSMVLAGPNKLKIGGGLGVMARFPIFLKDDDPDSFWGIVSAVISVDRLIEHTGLNDPDLSIEVGIAKNSNGVLSE